MIASIFLDFSLPNAATWFYFSFLLAHALFYRFDRLFSLRNWDLLTLYLIVPGFLCLQEAHALRNLIGAEKPVGDWERLARRADRLLLAGYIWLISGSAYYFVRCLFDLGLERRPAMSPNLNAAGLIWMAAALMICLTARAVRQVPDAPAQVGRGPIALTKVQDGAIAVVGIQNGTADWDEADTKFWVERGVAILLHLAVVAGLVMVGVTHFRDATTGTAMACLYLMLPYTATYVSQVHHVWPAVFILWAVYSYRRPLIAGSLLGVAAGSAFFPVLLFPLWFGFYRGRGTGRFSLAFFLTCGLSLSATATLLLLSGELHKYLTVALSMSDWQAWKAPKTESIWTGSHWAYRLPVFIAYMAFVVLTVFWPKPRNLGQVIAQTAGVVVGVQLWYADQGGVYALWYAPLLLLMVFRPDLTDVRPPIIERERDWVIRLARRVVAWGRRLGPKPRPTAAPV